MMESLNFVLVFLTICPLIVLSSGGQSFFYKTDCVRETDCELNRFLECSTRFKICDCPINMVWDTQSQSCMIKEGQSCLDFSSSSGQNNLKNSRGEPNCITNSSCIFGKCQCDDGYLRNGFGKCDLGYNMGCNDDESSSQQTCAWRFMLECSKSEKVCKCRGEWIDFVWDKIRQKCVSLVGSVCDLDREDSDDRLECVENAFCGVNNGRCQCTQGYGVTPKRTCLLKYGEKCDNLKGKKCDSYRFLNCQDGKCGCEFYGQMVYDQYAKECRMLAGEFCDLPLDGSNANYPTSGDFSEEGDEKLHRCIQDAVCTPPTPSHYHHSNNKGKCVCSAGKFKSSNGTCTNTKSYGHSCSFSGDCNQADFLTCTIISSTQGGTCSCHPKDMFYNGSECVVYPGKSCNTNPKCGRNSYCSNSEFCQCFEGYIMDVEAKDCIKVKEKVVEEKVEDTAQNSHPTPSTISDDKKNERESVGGGGWVSWESCLDMNIESIRFKKCNCSQHPEYLIWSEEKEQCLSLVGSSCHSNEECTENAYCDFETCQCETTARTTINKTCVIRKSHNPLGHLPYEGENPNYNYNDELPERTRFHPTSKPFTASSGYTFRQNSLSFFVNLIIFFLVLLEYCGKLY